MKPKEKGMNFFIQAFNSPKITLRLEFLILSAFSTYLDGKFSYSKQNQRIILHGSNVASPVTTIP
jgi:hypothetical protein